MAVFLLANSLCPANRFAQPNGSWVQVGSKTPISTGFFTDPAFLGFPSAIPRVCCWSVFRSFLVSIPGIYPITLPSSSFSDASLLPRSRASVCVRTPVAAGASDRSSHLSSVQPPYPSFASRSHAPTRRPPARGSRAPLRIASSPSLFILNLPIPHHKLLKSLSQKASGPGV